MSAARRGTVVLMQSGDREITGAIAEGMLAARELTAEQIGVVEAEIDRQHVEASLLRVAVNNFKTPEDYRLMTIKLRGDCARYFRPPGTLRRLGRRILGLYGLLVYALAMAYRSQDRLLGRRI